ncbi:hypothetical protein [Cellulomonas sp. GbtcB1]|uniref:hypothetical protein n=1 Tax=Cellulomonas sp. GbtcB1 TaxID=2824746 RepID=UPI001C303DF8|nr:hypothetical protein [Cellulomonas sp. GbtcB1]
MKMNIAHLGVGREGAGGDGDAAENGVGMRCPGREASASVTGVGADEDVVSPVRTGGDETIG